MDNTLHLLLEQWEDYARAQPGCDITRFIRSQHSDLADGEIARFKLAVERLERMTRRLKHFDVDSRDSN